MRLTVSSGHFGGAYMCWVMFTQQAHDECNGHRFAKGSKNRSDSALQSLNGEVRIILQILDL